MDLCLGIVKEIKEDSYDFTDLKWIVSESKWSDLLSENSVYNQLIKKNKSDEHWISRGVMCLKFLALEYYTGHKESVEDIGPPTLLDQMMVDGEVLMTKMAHPGILFAGMAILQSIALHSKKLIPVVWYTRSLMMYQRFLSFKALTIKNLALQQYELIEDIAPVEVLCEYINTCSYYWMKKKSEILIKKAIQKSKFRYLYTGVLGFRTKYQREPKTILYVDAESDQKYDFKEKTEQFYSDQIVDYKEHKDSKFDIPHDLELKDDTLLPVPRLVDETLSQSPLQPRDRLILLSIMYQKAFVSPSIEITNEEILAHCQRLLLHKDTYAIAFMALYSRSLSEINDWNKYHRCLTQLDLLSKLFTTYNDINPVSVNRLPYMFSTMFPNTFEQNRTLGDFYTQKGYVKTALKHYSACGLYDKVVSCYLQSGRVSAALEVVQDQIKKSKEKSFRFLCLLGDCKTDVEDKIKCYEESWEVSGKRYGLAQRKLGRIFFHKQDWKKTIFHYGLATTANFLILDGWFAIGYSHLRLQQWVEACSAFRNCVTIDSEHIESWGNLASTLLHLKEYVQAEQALSNCVRVNPESYKMWSNYLVCCIQLKDYNGCIRCCLNIGRLSSKNANDNSQKLIAQILKTVCGGIVKLKKDDPQLKFLKNQLKYCLTQLSDKDSPLKFGIELYDAYATCFLALNDFDSWFEYMIKTLRAIDRLVPHETKHQVKILEKIIGIHKSLSEQGFDKNSLDKQKEEIEYFLNKYKNGSPEEVKKLSQMLAEK